MQDRGFFIDQSRPEYVQYPLHLKDGQDQYVAIFLQQVPGFLDQLVDGVHLVGGKFDLLLLKFLSDFGHHH